MTDLEITKACADAMGIEVQLGLKPVAHTYQHWVIRHKNGRIEQYKPLYDDAQAMALIHKFNINIAQLSDGNKKVFIRRSRNSSSSIFEADSPDLRKAICQCVALTRCPHD